MCSCIYSVYYIYAVWKKIVEAIIQKFSTYKSYIGANGCPRYGITTRQDQDLSM